MEYKGHSLGHDRRQTKCKLRQSFSFFRGPNASRSRVDEWRVDSVDPPKNETTRSCGARSFLVVISVLGRVSPKIRDANRPRERYTNTRGGIFDWSRQGTTKLKEESGQKCCSCRDANRKGEEPTSARFTHGSEVMRQLVRQAPR